MMRRLVEILNQQNCQTYLTLTTYFDIIVNVILLIQEFTMNLAS